jgi:hypothetical protein
LLAVARARSGAAKAPQRTSGNGATAANGATAGNGASAGAEEPDRAPSPVLPSSHGRPTRGPAADMRAKRARGSRPERKRRTDD